MNRRAVRAATLAWLMGTAGLAGCLGPDGDLAGVRDQGFDAAAGLHVCGFVLDSELFPLAKATVGLRPLDLSTTTDANGSFCLGPVEPFTDVEVWAEADGYESNVVFVTVEESMPPTVMIALEAVPGLEPYHQTTPHVAFIECAWASSLLGTLPCNPVDRTLGTSLTVDNSQWFFEIPAANLKTLLFEAYWTGNALGRDMRFILLIPDIVESNYATGEPMLDGRGGSPYRTWLYPGERGERGSQDFVGDELTPYQMLYRPWVTNSTLGVFAVYVNHRVESFYTFFYNREAPLDFTALPDT